MKLSTKGTYGLRALVDLAKHSQDGPSSISEISERQKISDSYLEQLFSLLKKGGFITSVRGTKGGYVIAKPMDQIIVGDVLRTLEGGLTVVDCVNDNDACGRSCECVTRYVWAKINESINAAVDNMTLLDVVNGSNQ